MFLRGLSVLSYALAGVFVIMEGLVDGVSGLKTLFDGMLASNFMGLIMGVVVGVVNHVVNHLASLSFTVLFGKLFLEEGSSELDGSSSSLSSSMSSFMGGFVVSNLLLSDLFSDLSTDCSQFFEISSTLVGCQVSNGVDCDDSVTCSRLQDFILDDLSSSLSNLFFERMHMLLHQLLSQFLEMVSDLLFGLFKVSFLGGMLGQKFSVLNNNFVNLLLDRLCGFFDDLSVSLQDVTNVLADQDLGDVVLRDLHFALSEEDGRLSTNGVVVSLFHLGLGILEVLGSVFLSRVHEDKSHGLKSILHSFTLGGSLLSEAFLVSSDSNLSPVLVVEDFACALEDSSD